MRKTSTPARSASAAKKPVTRTAKVKAITPPTDPKQLAAAKLARLTGDEKLASRLVKAGLGSVHRIAAMPSRTLLAHMDGKLTRLEERAVYAAQHYARQMIVYGADQAITETLAGSVNGSWWTDWFDGKKPDRQRECHCGCCGSIFSLKAYLFDLLDLLAQDWDIDLDDVEALLLRSFSSIKFFEPANSRVITRDLDCEALNAPLPQVRIAVEVLESYFGKIGKPLPSSVSGWKNKFVDGLLRLITPREVQVAVLAGANTTILTIAKLEAKAGLSPDFATSLAAWKTKLNTLVLNLAGIDEAVTLLSDYAEDFTGFAPNTLRPAAQDDATPDEKWQRELTVRFERARDATMRQWLADYRDALVTASGKEVEVLEAGLFISLSSGSCRTTTRLQEVVTSVQQIVENIRSGEIAALNRPDIGNSRADALRDTAALPLAESAWQRLRDYETWLGGMYGWVYPENVLNPLVAELIDPSKERTPLAIRECYLNWASGRRMVDQDLIASPVLAELREGARTVALARWKAAVDEKSAEAEGYFGGNADIPLEFLTAIESDLLFPLSAGRVLSQFEHFAEAHEWFSLLYHPFTRTKHPIFGQVPFDDQPAAGETHTGSAWLDTPFDPIAIAHRRPGVWLRYTILAMVRNLIDWADADFARGLPDTVQRAEERYELAKKLLSAKVLENECETLILDIQKTIVNLFGIPKKQAAAYTQSLLQVQSIKVLEQAQKDITKALQGKRSLKQKQAAVSRAVDKAVKSDRKEHPSRPLAVEWRTGLEAGQKLENAIFFQPEPDGPLPPGPEPQPRPEPKPGGRPGMPPFDEFIPDRPPDDLVEPPPPPAPPMVVSLAFCIPLNPAIGQLDKQIDTQLLKLKHCLDFIGEPQTLRVYGCDTYDAATGLINRPASALDQLSYATDQPRYRYNFLIEKARQYVEAAQQIGSLLLQALQNSDNEAFQQLKAEHAIALAGATVEVRRLSQVEAYHGVDIAKLQSERADSQVEFWDQRAGDDIDNTWESMSTMEQAGIGLAVASAGLQAVALAPMALGVLAGAAGTLLGGGIAAAGTLTSLSGAGAPVGLPILLAGMGVSSVSAVGALLAGGAGLLQGAGGVAGTLSQAALTYGAFERRFEEWKNQFTLATFDAQIADLQETLADDRVAIADQELVIAQLQLAHAREELRFLQTKLMNVVLYDWMVRVLSRDYRTLMQIATCVARMAQRALEFERQEPVRIIVDDYWNIGAGVLGAPDLTQEQRSLGLLGAERLLTDLTKLDAFKLATERRRQQISKTISLARMMPVELVEFRRSGTITFNALMDWFDDDFQGHYLRLIKSVKVSVLAIVPPIDGIHAALQNTGESSVVVSEDGGLTFVKKRAMRNFGERISLDALFNESGLFVLNYEDPMVLPFEGLGVETQWTLEMPRGNNRFDFETIADVFLTVEYTAEYSRTYEEQQRIERSNVDVFEDTAVPLRLQFPDLWYHLKNHHTDAAGGPAPFPFKFRLPRTAFAPNLPDPIHVAHLTLLVSGELTSAEQELVADGLVIMHQAAGSSSPTVLHQGKPPRLGPPADAGDPSSAFGHPLFGPTSILLSTRGSSANGLPSSPAIGAAAPDEWTIAFSPTLFPAAIQKISDIMLVVTVRGRRE